MKKMILALAILMTTLSSFAGDETVSPRVLEAFQNEFASAKEVNWTAGTNYYKADFTFNDQQVSAFYSQDGELIGITRNITILDLPVNLQATIKKSYSGFWIADLFEVSKSDSTGYYITLENADTMVVLKSSADSDWNVYKKTKKI